MSQDEQTQLLKEIRDILLEQNRLVDEQWARSNEQWEHHHRANRRAMMGCFSSIAAMIVIALLIVASRNF
ncbi:MAG: hypothetical protein ABUL64_02670 [Singulisphaera sp.]